MTLTSGYVFEKEEEKRERKKWKFNTKISFVISDRRKQSTVNSFNFFPNSKHHPEACSIIKNFINFNHFRFFKEKKNSTPLSTRSTIQVIKFYLWRLKNSISNQKTTQFRWSHVINIRNTQISSSSISRSSKSRIWNLKFIGIVLLKFQKLFGKVNSLELQNTILYTFMKFEIRHHTRFNVCIC